MARKARLAVAGHPHLLSQARAGTPVFTDDGDRALYRDAMCSLAADGEVALHAYALLVDRVLMVVTPRQSEDLGRFVQKLNRRFVPAFNERHARSGALWTSRFQASALDAEHYLLPATLMIEQAAVRSGLVDSAIDWRWSSARHHAGRAPESCINEHPRWWQTGNTPFEREARHEAELRHLLDAATVETLQAALRGGWPLGPAEFLDTIARLDGATVEPAPRGRPRKRPPGPFT